MLQQEVVLLLVMQLNKPVLEKGGMYNLVESVEVEIGGQKIDKHYGAWMDIWSELACGACGPNGSDTNTKQSGKCKVVGHSETALTATYAADSGAGRS